MRVRRPHVLSCIVLVGLCLLSASHSTKAQGLHALKPTFEYSGTAWTRAGGYGWTSPPLEERFASRTEFSGKAIWRPASWLSLVGGARFQSRLYEGTDHNDATLYLEETYARARWNRFSARVGAQTVRWGKIDGVSPLDNINPTDLQDGPLRPVQERKIVLPMGNLEYVRDLTSIQVLWIPQFRPDRLDYFGHNWALFGLGDCDACPEVITENISFGLVNSEIGARVQTSIAGRDWAVSVFHTREDRPEVAPLDLPPDLPIGEMSRNASLQDYARLAQVLQQPIQLRYKRQTVIGLEMEGASGQYGYRADMAHVRDEPFYTSTFSLLRRPVSTIAVGVDRRDLFGMYVNLQSITEVIHDYAPTIVGNNQWTQTFTADVERSTWNDNLTLSVTSAYELRPYALTLTPSVTFTHWGRVNAEVGAHILDRGPRNFLRYFERNDEVYMTLEYQF